MDAGDQWSEEDLGDYAETAGPLTLPLLDYVAAESPDELLAGADFSTIDMTSEQVAGVTGSMARKVYNDFERSNPPIESIEFDGRWHYRMSPDTADLEDATSALNATRTRDRLASISLHSPADTDVREAARGRSIVASRCALGARGYAQEEGR